MKQNKQQQKTLLSSILSYIAKFYSIFGSRNRIFMQFKSLVCLVWYFIFTEYSELCRMNFENCFTNAFLCFQGISKSYLRIIFNLRKSKLTDTCRKDSKIQFKLRKHLVSPPLGNNDSTKEIVPEGINTVKLSLFLFLLHSFLYLR